MSKQDHEPLIQLIGNRELTFLESVAASVGITNGKNVNAMCMKIILIDRNENERKTFITNLLNIKNTYFSYLKQTEDMINYRLTIFINNFTKLQTVNEIVNGIKLLNILITHYQYHLNSLRPLVIKNNYSFEENKLYKKVFEKWLTDLKVEHPQTYTPVFNQEFKKSIAEMITRKLINKPESCITYGSFSLYLYDDSIKYNDVDIYAKDTYYYLICLIGIVYFTTGKELSINAIPYVDGLRIIRDETKYDTDFTYDTNIFDCIHMDESIFKKLPYINYNGIRILDPKIQLIQAIRQLSVFDRRYKLYNEYDKMLKSLLYYSNISEVDLKTRAIPEYSWQFRMNNKYEEMKDIKKLPDILPMLYKEPSYFKTIIDNITYITIINYNHNEKMNIDMFVYSLFPSVTKKSMKYASLFNEDVYEGKNTIVMTHNTLETYFTKDFELTLLSIISFISSYTLYHVLHRRDATNLFNLVYTLMQQKTNNSDWKIERYKNTGNHRIISFHRLLFTSLLVKSEPFEFIEKDNMNAMINSKQ